MNRVVQRRGNLPRLWQHEALGEGLRRVLLRCLELAAVSANTDVHRARLALKRGRAVLRLAKALGMPWATTERHRLARHARRVATERDWEVVAGLARESATELRGDARRCALAIAATRAARAVRVAAWARWLIAERERMSRRPWPELTRPRLRRALARSARRVRRQADEAGDSPSSRVLHEWRKLVIVLREQLYVLQPLVRDQHRQLAPRLHELARRLGAAGDWRMLSDAVRGPSRHAPLPGGPGRVIAHAENARQRALTQARIEWKALRSELRKKLV